MKRRNFLKASTILPIGLSGFGVKNLSANPLFNNMGLAAATNDNILVLIQLNGGNDGLNTVIPLDQYTNLSKARSNVLITETEVLKLTGTTLTGLHPGMTAMRDMYDSGLLNIVQSVGYPSPNFSHFRSMDIWHTGSNSNEVWDTGWIGRTLNEEFPNYPTGYPNTDMPDPLALGIGTFTTSTIGPNGQTGIGISDPNTVYNLINGNTDPAPNSRYGKELAYIRLINEQTNKYTASIKAASDKGNNLSTKYGSGNRLAEQLKIVARLISGGLKTKVYVVSLGGFDTHSTQADPQNHSIGAHNNLLTTLSDAIGAFQDDLKLLGVQDKVAGMTYSEFGRRIMSNLSGGTDHGAAAPLFVFGTGVQGGIIGANPTIPDSVMVDDNLPMQFDMRQVYVSVIKDWFGLSGNKANNAMGGITADTLPIFKSNNASIQDYANIFSRINMHEPVPNPVQTTTKLPITTDGGLISIKLFDPLGQLVSQVYTGNVAAGTSSHIINMEGMRAGNYFVQLSQGNKVLSKVLVKL